MLDDLYPATRFGVSVGLLEKEVPVWYATEEFANVYEVEVVRRKCPLERDIVDFKVTVGWNPFGLYGRKVGTGHDRRRILVCHVLRLSV